MSAIFIPGGTITFTNNIDLLVATSSTVGVITKAGTRFIHDYLANNIFTGTGAGNFTMTGTFNAGFGFGTMPVITSGSNNASCGYNTFSSLSSGNSNIAIGSGAGTAYTTTSNNIAIGNVGNVADSGVMRLGTSGTHVKTFISGINGVTPDTADGVPLYLGSAGQFGTVGTPATQALTATQVAFGSGANLLTSATSLTYISGTRTLSVGVAGSSGVFRVVNNAGTTDMQYTAASSTLLLGAAGGTGSLQFNNSTPLYISSLLTYYEETTTINTTLSGSWAALAFALTVTRIGNIVTMSWPSLSAVSTVNNQTLSTPANSIPAKFLPNADVDRIVPVFDSTFNNLMAIAGLLIVTFATNNLIFYGPAFSGTTGVFSGIGATTGVRASTISYLV